MFNKAKSGCGLCKVAPDFSVSVDIEIAESRSMHRIACTSESCALLRYECKHVRDCMLLQVGCNLRAVDQHVHVLMSCD